MPLRARGFHGTDLYSAPTACGRKRFFLELRSVLPSHVRSRRRGIGHVASNLRHDALVEGSSTFEVRNVPATHVAVGLSATVFKVGDAKRVLRRFEKVCIRCTALFRYHVSMSPTAKWIFPASLGPSLARSRSRM